MTDNRLPTTESRRPLWAASGAKPNAYVGIQGGGFASVKGTPGGRFLVQNLRGFAPSGREVLHHQVTFAQRDPAQLSDE